MNSEEFLKELWRRVDDIKSVGGRELWILKNLEEFFGREVVENTKKILERAGIKVVE